MKKLLYLIGCTLMSLACNQRRNGMETVSIQDSANYKLLKDFYGDIVRDDDAFYYKLEEILSRGNSYSIRIKAPIDDCELKLFADFSDTTDYYGSKRSFASYCIRKDSLNYVFFHHFSLPDSLLRSLDSFKVNEVTYFVPLTGHQDKVRLGKFKDVSICFLDIDFDGKEELMVKNFQDGQRWLDTYTPYKFINGELKRDTIYDCINRNYIYPILDDWTEFDYPNNELTISLSCGYIGNEKITYKVKDRHPNLVKREYYYCLWDSLGKRIIYNDKDSIVTYYNDGDKYEGLY